MREDDIERLFVAHAQPLYAFAAYHMGDATLAEEIVGDTFERLVRTRRRFDRRKGSEQSWVYTIALNVVRDRQRRGVAERRAMDHVRDAHDRATHDDPLARIEARDEITRALATLDDDVRELLALRFGADLRLRDIAELTGRPVSTVHECVRRGLRDLRKELDSELDEACSTAAAPAARRRHGG